MESEIDKAVTEIGERDRRLKKIDDMIGEIHWVLDNMRGTFHALVEEFYEYHIPYNPKITKREILKDDGFKSLIKTGNRIPDRTERHNKLFKNLAILFLQGGFAKNEIDKYIKLIIDNCENADAKEIYGWMKHIASDKEKEWKFNPNEFNQSVEKIENYDDKKD